jgi:hypothetical protein
MLGVAVLDELRLHERNVFCDRTEIGAGQTGKGPLIAGLAYVGYPTLATQVDVEQNRGPLVKSIVRCEL